MLRLSVPFLLLFLRKPALSLAVSESSAVLPAPQNLTIQSYNLQNVLRWSPVKGIDGSVSYNVQLSQSNGPWKNVNCTNITKPDCDFDHGSLWSTIILRVRAKQGELKSAWTKTVPFQAKKDTTLGPPRAINIISEPNLLTVSFLPPFEHAANYPAFRYTIDYWETSTGTKKTKTTMNTEYYFRDLKERTEYCFQIKAELPVINKTGQSDPYCKQTATAEATTILYVTLILGFAVFVLVAIFLCLIVIRKYQSTIKSFWQAPLTIPSHYEEDLQNAEISMVEEFQNCAKEEQWDTVSVISNAEQNQTMTNSFTNENQHANLLEVEEHR